MLSVAIVGKPNVGKSTLFNRMISKNKAIVDDMPGVTRDRIYDEVEWLTRKFELIDTGGLENSKIGFQANINEQVNFAIEEAQVIIFLVSYLNGIDENDFFVAKTLKKYLKNKKVILCVNKAEKKVTDEENKFYSLGFGKPYFVSAAHGIGIGDLLDEIILQSNKVADEPKQEDNFCFCIIGKPNVGKSTLFNTIINENRVIVSDIPGSTRDSIDTTFKYNNQEFTIIDTAGIRRKGKIKINVEKYAVLRAQKAIKRSKCILLVLDVAEGFTEQDEIIGGLAYEANIPTIIVVNKWDKISKDTNTMSKITKEIRQKFKYLFWAPIVFISAMDKKRISTIFDTIEKINLQANVKISTSALNDIVLKAQMLQEPPLFKGGRLKISYATQVQSQIPTFVIFCNDSKYLHFSYARYMENQIRSAFGLEIVPITLYWKTKE